MAGHSYVYTIYVAADAGRVWEALTSNAMLQRYWDAEWQIDSEWTTGAAIVFRTGGAVFSQGEVLESVPDRRLVYSWPNPPEEQGDAPPEHLAWEIETAGPGTAKLTLTHTNLTAENHAGVSRGWPAILSSLKTLLETGSPLVFAK